MINEQGLIFSKSQKELLKIIYIQGHVDETPKEEIIINYYGNKSQIPIEENLLGENNENNLDNNSNLIRPDDFRNELVFIRYKEIYIGSLSIHNFYKREKFGLNRYDKNCFYIGYWKNNMKHGIGYLKINENQMYLGNFDKNQIDGFGILYYKDSSTFFCGGYNKGKFDTGIYYNMKNDIFYRGSIKNNQKNDHFCTFFDTTKGNMFIGEIIDNVFNKGYLGNCELKENKGDGEGEGGNEDDEIVVDFNVQKIFYFDGLGENNKRFIHYVQFTPEFFNQMEEIMNTVFQADFNLKDQSEEILAYFKFLEEIENKNEYTHNIEKYIPNEYSIEYEFVTKFNEIYDRFRLGQQDLNLQQYEEILDNPITTE